jgi:inosose dehydratase
MANIRLGASTYSWIMKDEGKAHENQLDHHINVVARAGLEGIEPIHFWMGDLSDPDRLEACLKENGIDLAGCALTLEWNHPEETEKERRDADWMIDVLSRFPNSMLLTVQFPTGRHDLEQRQQNLINNVNRVSKRAADAGVPASYHPNSPDISINRTAEDYDVILNALDSSVTGWTPDVGHIINGGMDPLSKMKEFKDLINYVHYKDWDGDPQWALMGEGKVDFRGITQWLVDQNYSGWIICEDEADRAVDEPDNVTCHDGEYCDKYLKPLIGG